MPTWVATLLDLPLKITLILMAAIVLRSVTHRLVDRIAEGIATGRAGLRRLDEKLPTATARLGASATPTARREQRARTTASLLKSATTAAVATVTVLSVMPLLGLGASLPPLLASASVLGVALGFGAQTLVKDVLAGLFMLVEDQYGVGDVVDLGTVVGTVESIGLRVTRLRDADGAVWYLRNGEILRVGNLSQGWARAVLDITLEPGTDLIRARRLLTAVASELAADDTYGADILTDPELLGIEAVTKDAVALRLVVRTASMRQWDVARELRRRILDRFTAEDLPVPIGMALAPPSAE